MTDILIETAEGATIALHALTEAALEGFLAGQPPLVAKLAEMGRFKAKAGQFLMVPGSEPGADMALFGLGETAAPDGMAFRPLPAKAPPGDYRLAAVPEGLTADRIALAWALGSYGFDRYKKKKQAEDGRARLVAPAGADLVQVRSLASACALARDLVNTPANDLGPVELEMAARDVAEAFGAEIAVVVGDDLLTQNYPAIHAVGRAADPKRASRMIEMTWGAPDAPLIAIVGKGVVFDTGGLDLKPSSGMRQMKKDMGGAAHALGLARMVMSAGLAVRLVVLLPVVENAVSGDAMRPGDVLASRKGLTIEVGNTDAEGRLILADALTRAEELDPVLTIDMATLTGAARVALGPQVIPFYTADDALAAEMAAAAADVGDPLWRMPLWAGYEDSLDSDIADLKNDPDGWAQAGSVTAALFLKRFAPKGPWVHLDIFAWNPRGRPGYPAGAEAQAIRALFAVLKARYPA
jgi:leucyl aminopeptidase